MIFSKNITVLHKNGFRTDYTHVTEFDIIPDSIPYLLIKGESTDTFGMPYNLIDRLPIKDLQMTIIDWYIPPQ